MELRDRFRKIASRLIDQESARVIVPPQRPASGYWFGGGNMVQDDAENLWLVGRYRNQGDSRTGLGAGERGLELAIFCSQDNGQSFEKFTSFSKEDLGVANHQVLSIEGSAVRFVDHNVELFVSSEKSGIEYPDGLDSYLKPGTGVWTIERLQADSMAALKQAPVETVLRCNDPRYVHVKDPFLAEVDGSDLLMFCTHPFCWTSSNTGYVSLSRDVSESDLNLIRQAKLEFFPRGCTWDVAITRGTAVLALPSVGVLSGRDVRLLFYDGGECVRDLDQHEESVKRPRGYSCEELGGVAFFEGGRLGQIERLSLTAPMFVSPHGTGCSRYVDVLQTADRYYATWQQAQDDGSQPLVMNVVERSEIEAMLRD